MCDDSGPRSHVYKRRFKDISRRRTTLMALNNSRSRSAGELNCQEYYNNGKSTFEGVGRIEGCFSRGVREIHVEQVDLNLLIQHKTIE